MYTCSLIVATLDERPKELRRLLDSLINQTFKNFEIIVVSQGDFDLTENILKEYELNCSHVYSSEKGLSKARNVGLKLVKGCYVSVSDDDCWYPPDALAEVCTTFNNNPSEAVCCFRIYDSVSNIFYKNYAPKKRRLNSFTICKISSIEFFFRSDIIREGIMFDECFGVGSIYNSGEENLFLNEILKHKHIISYFPIIIVFHRRYANRKVSMRLQYMIGKYYLFKNLYSWAGILFYYIFYIKHYLLIESKFKSLFPFLS